MMFLFTLLFVTSVYAADTHDDNVDAYVKQLSNGAYVHLEDIYDSGKKVYMMDTIITLKKVRDFVDMVQFTENSDISSRELRKQGITDITRQIESDRAKDASRWKDLGKCIEQLQSVDQAQEKIAKTNEWQLVVNELTDNEKAVRSILNSYVTLQGLKQNSSDNTKGCCLIS